MKITKFVHSCLMVEMPDPVNRTVVFDPGVFSEQAFDITKREYLDDIVITHAHADHFSLDMVKKIVAKFPEVRITTTSEVAHNLASEGITASTEPPDGMAFFDSPHESVEPLFEQPQEIGVHYLDKFSHPGDSHNFTETKQILALPVTAPWGSLINAVKLAMELKPKHVLPIHDWHWSDEARRQTYAMLEQKFADQGITFHKLETGKSIVID